MEIRTSSTYYKKLKNIKTKLQDIVITLDENIEIPMIMIKFKDGHLGEYLRGFKNIKNFLKYGYNRIIKKCPYRHRKCIGEKCSLYIINNSTGDCAKVWSVMILLKNGG